MQQYQSFARCYDRFMENVDYGQWLCRLKHLWEEAGFTPKTLLEFGCGTGNFTLPLARQGYQITGVDLSEEMINQAKQKAQKEQLSVPFEVEDICDYQAQQEVDGVLCLCDTINYLTEPEDVQEAFFAAADAVKEGGFFLFDVNTPYRFAKVYGSQTFSFVAEDAAYIWENSYDPQEQINTYDVHFFLRRPDGTYDRREEVHEERAYPQLTLTVMLENAGFMVCSMTGETGNEATQTDQRWTFLAVKERSNGDE